MPTVIELARAAEKAGWRGDDAFMAVCVALGETDGKDRSHNYNPATGDDSWGPWQINTLGDLWPELQRKYGLNRKEELWDVNLNARIGYDKWKARGWQPWGAAKRQTYYLHGRYARARAGFTELAMEGPMSWRVAPCIKQMIAEANKIAPRRSRASDGTIGDSAHAGTKSEHNPDSRGIVHAVDLTHDPANGWDCHKRVAEIVARHDRRILYVIWYGVMYRSYDKPGIPAWSPGRDKNWGHHKHMHVSVKSGTTFENDVRPWFGEEDEVTDEDIKKIVDKTVAALKPVIVRAVAVVANGEDNAFYRVPEDYRSKSIKQMIEDAAAQR